MKILYIITKSNFGGAQKYTYELAKAAQSAGHDVLVACGGTGQAGADTGELVERLQTESIKAILIEHFMRDVSWLRDLRAFIELYQLIRRERPDVVHISSSKAGGIGGAAARVAGISNIIFTIHGLPAEESWRPRWQRFLISFATWLSVLLAHQTIVLSSESRQQLAKLPLIADKLRLVHIGVAPPKLMDRKEARRALQIPPQALCIGGIGELHPNKNWFLALSTVATLPPQTHLCLIGGGEEYDQLRKQVKQLQLEERVQLMGYLPDAAQYLAAFDIFLLPSKKEGLPYVLLEAGAVGLPVVASDLPGTREVVTTGENGLLVQPTMTDLTASLTMLLRDEGMRTRLGSSLRDHVRQDFSQAAMIEKTFALYSMTTASTDRTEA
jgi:glycosyltransferase involved in cell wall biosynthesis